MADKKNNDSLFQWNFNLEDSDSDFTDIDFSNSGKKAAEPSDKDIQPIIFVRDETGRKKTEERQKPDEERVTGAGTKRTSSGQRKPVQKKPAQKKKKGSSLPNLNWKLIAVVAAAVILIALLVVLLGKCGKKEEKVWTKVEADSKIKTLMDEYFNAKRDGNADKMRGVLVTDAVVNASVMALESQIYNDYTDIQLQQYPGIKKNEYVVCASYDTELTVYKASVPTLSWFYALPDSTNKLRLMTVTEMEKDENKTILNYVGAAYSLLKDTTVAEAEARNQAAVSADPLLAEYLENIKKGDYHKYPTGAASTDDPAASAENPNPQQSTETPSPGTQSSVMYVSATTLNMRSAPTTAEQNVLWKFPKGYAVTVLSLDNGWYRIRDDISTNPASGNGQSVTGGEGYVSADWLVSDYSAISW